MSRRGKTLDVLRNTKPLSFFKIQSFDKAAYLVEVNYKTNEVNVKGEIPRFGALILPVLVKLFWY